MKLAVSSYEPSGEKKNLPPIIMLHGILDSKKTWFQIAPKLANRTGRKIYCLDARNHGESPWSEDFDFEFMMRDLEEFMNSNRIQKAILLGHSMGGKTVMKFATENPQRVEKLIIEDMIPRPFSAKGWRLIVVAIEILKESLGVIPDDSDLITAKRAIGRYFSENLPLMTPRGSQEFGIEVMPLKKVGGEFHWKTNLEVLSRVLTTNESFDIPLKTSYSRDALFIYGTKSFVKIANEPSIPKYFPKALMKPIEQATHVVHYDKPDEFLEEVVKYINENVQPSIPLSKY